MYAKVKHDNDFSASNYELVYRFEITTLEPFDQLEVMIDANTGNLIRKLTMIENAAGTVNTLYNGQRSFTTQWRGWPNNDYVLKDTDSGDKLHTLLYSESTAWEFRPEVDDDDNVWSRAAATSHWGVQMAWNYFITQHSRNGMDGAGGKIKIEGESTEERTKYYTRVGYDGVRYDHVSFGRTSAGVNEGINGALSSLDVVGHEFTHGVARYAVDLADSGEPAALEKSFCDIFGVMVERYIQGTEDWVIGDDTDYRIRSLEFPNSFFSGKWV